jgi:hypothetical protein
MEDKILIALIASISALIGSLIPQIFTFFNNKAQREFEKNKLEHNRQSQVYEELLLALQKTMNEGDLSFKELQNAILKISLHGDQSTANEVEKYYRELVQRGSELKPQEHASFQKDILNSMRVQLKLSPVESFELIRFTPQ